MRSGPLTPEQVEEAIKTLIENEVTPDNYDIEDSRHFWAEKITDLLSNLGVFG